MADSILVIKFGGTSLGTPGRVSRAAKRIRALHRLDVGVVGVASAVAHTTDRILTWIQRLGASTSDAAREIDRALATGEALSSALMAGKLRALGMDAVSLSGGEAGIEAAGEFGAGTIARVDPAPIQRLLSNGKTPIVAGFQGRRADGETVTLGRGASDTTAVAIAAALGSVPCHIVTDVSAVHDRDPNLHPTARPFVELSHAELVQLAEDGARVMHPAAARIALEHRVPLFVYSYRAPLGDTYGTRIGSGET
jgi:aspartate kinase